MSDDTKKMLHKTTRRLLRNGFVSLRYVDGRAVYTATPETHFTEAESETVLRTIQAAGPAGMTCGEVAAKTGMSLIKVQCICGDIPG